ncbi:MAG: PspC domain-containing protein [Ilumatobacteraceae bacterium]
MPHAGPLSFAKRDHDRVVDGVAGGFADQHGLDVIVVRAALVVLACAGGLGIALYALGTLVASPPGATVPPPHPHDQRRNLSVGLVTIGVVLVMRSTGLWLGDGVMAPLVVIAVGLVLIAVVRPHAAPVADLQTGRHARERLIAGAVFVAAGVALVGSTASLPNNVRAGSFAASLTIIGIAIVLGPWLTSLAQQAAAERRERIRANEREAVAAHLHDSVLQTLALIQRNADDPRRTVTLARQQERELREWLYGTHDESASTLEGAVRAMADDVEVAYDVRLDVVVVGDRQIDDHLSALVAALREACVNAAKHSGTTEISVFVEVGHDAIEAFVRDRGCGFDRADTSPDRHGIASSIEARMERIGGSSVIETVVGEGTEVQLVLPVLTATPTDAGSALR